VSNAVVFVLSFVCLTDAPLSQQAASFRSSLSSQSVITIRKSVKESSRRAYDKPWQRWCEFIRQFYGYPSDDVSHIDKYLPYQLDPEAVNWLVILFATYLADVCSLAAGTVRSTLSGVRFHFQCGFCSTSPFDNPALSALRKAIGNDPKRAPLREKKALPITLSMLESAVRKLTADPHNMSQLLLAAALILSFCCMFRPSEYCFTRDDSHVLRALQVLFEIKDLSHPAGSRFIDATQVRDVSFSAVILIKFMLSSAKNISFRVGATMWHSAVSTDPDCVNLCQAMFTWAVRANLQPGDYFLSYRPRPSSDSIRLNYRALAAVIKATASSFGFDPWFFSCYSTRVGCASLLRAAGASDGFIMMMGRWKTLPACLGYQANSSSMQDTMMSLLSSRELFTERDIRLNSTISSVVRVDLAPVVQVDNRTFVIDR
jgi:hypothetical protein